MENNMKSRFLVIFLCFVLWGIPSGAQNVAIKTNLLYDLTTTVNAGVELGLSPRWTLDVSANYNAWTLSHDRKWKHWLVQPEARYWFCDPFAGHFLGLKNGIKFLGTDFSQLSDHRFQGWMAGAGVAYGYTWILGRYWNLEAEIGLGYIYSRYDKFECAGCGQKTETGQPHHYLGPTKAAVNLIYVF